MALPTAMNEHLPALKEMINAKLRNPDAFDVISRNLAASGAVLAGGSILQVIAKYKASRLDLDFYCPTKHILVFIESFTTPRKAGATPIFDNCSMSTQTATFYCSSFLRKNGIRKIYRLSRIDNESPEAIAVPRFVRGKEYAQMIDIMSVRNSRPITGVVSNFDLTFCQVWYDGRSIWSTHPDHITERNGILQKDYTNLFIRGNEFLSKRVKKYKDRGFTIRLDPDAAKLSVDDILNRKTCINPTPSVDRTEDPEYLKRWATRLIMKWILGVRGARSRSVNLDKPDTLTPAGIDINDVMVIPNKDAYFNKAHITAPNQTGNILETRGSRYTDEITFEPDDGYDSEEYTDLANLKALEAHKEFNSPNDLVPLESITADLRYYRQANILLRNTLYPHIYKSGPSLGYMIESFNRTNIAPPINPKHIESLKRYKAVLETYCTRKGECYIMKSGDETVYDLHNHPLDGAISQDGMEGYLTTHLKDVDKTSVPCYYKPNAPGPGNPKPAGNCYKSISLSEVKMIVSDEFWAKYSKPIPIKTGLGETISMWNTTLTNVKTHDEHFGDIFTKSICPYCLQFAERDGGCAYIGHENPTGLTADHYPYCQKDFVVQEIVDKYKAAAEELDPGVPPHMEWCVECGRPSVGHEHFNTSDPTGKEDPPKKPDPHHPERMIYDYGKCAGGGRAELFARILAIRAVYRDAGITDPKTERLTAALAADEAPNDADLMARGQAIAAQELAARKWNNAPIPENKVYNNVAYANNRNSNDNNNNAAGPGLNAANLEGGKKTRRKVKRNRRSTRKV